MKYIAVCFCLIVFSLSFQAQTPDQILATANGQKFTVKDLPPEVGEAYTSLSKNIAETRKAMLEQQIIETIFETEAKTKNQTLEKYLEQIKAKVPAPAEKDIQAVYDANRAALGDKPLAEVRPQIVNFLRQEPEQKALLAAFNTLKTKYKVAPGKDVNALSLRPVDVLATVGAKTISVKDFEEKNRITLYEAKAKIFDAVKFALNELIYNALVSAEAKSLNLETSDLIAREITDKMREYTDDERYGLETNLRQRLSAKYKTQILLKEPAPVVLNIPTANAPFKGSPTAPVTVIMFSDFQCSACSATHPVLQKVLAEYPSDKIRFVVRNFPLTTIHENSFQAAIAANAAQAQGKFFEYTEVLYRNQDALDAASLKKYAGELGLNLPQFELDLQSERIAEAVRKDMAEGRSYGITGTPTIFVNGVKVRVTTAEGFRDAIDKALKK
ncbi:MAG TPA: thioredoxin domain-containing protein [Pyrinomonadaceae bacterium]|jgi:protein-disulfide isomerase|nr:thioredoxin domain-containing protein [Pyrinomonadaceae bacterium]